MQNRLNAAVLLLLVLFLTRDGWYEATPEHAANFVTHKAASPTTDIGSIYIPNVGIYPAVRVKDAKPDKPVKPPKETKPPKEM